MAERCDAIVVIGSANSSNTRALEKLAREAGCARVFRINTAEELPDDLAGTVGVTAGASASEELVDQVVVRLGVAPDGVEIAKVTDEDEYFPPPRNLRGLIDGHRRARHLHPRRLDPRPPPVRRPLHPGIRRAHDPDLTGSATRIGEAGAGEARRAGARTTRVTLRRPPGGAAPSALLGSAKPAPARPAELAQGRHGSRCADRQAEQPRAR